MFDDVRRDRLINLRRDGVKHIESPIIFANRFRSPTGVRCQNTALTQPGRQYEPNDQNAATREDRYWVTVAMLSPHLLSTTMPYPLTHNSERDVWVEPSNNPNIRAQDNQQVPPV